MADVKDRHEEPKKPANMESITISLVVYIVVVGLIIMFLHHGEVDLNSVFAAFAIVLAATVAVCGALLYFGILTVPMLREKFRIYNNRNARFGKLHKDKDYLEPNSSDYLEIQNEITRLRKCLTKDAIEVRKLCVCKKNDSLRKLFVVLTAVVLLSYISFASVAATVIVAFVSLQEESETSNPDNNENDFSIVFEGEVIDVEDVPYIGSHEIEDNFIHTDEAEYMRSLTEEELRLLQLLVHWKAAGEDEKGQIQIANVIFNRLRSPNFPNTVMDVILQVGAFAATERDDFETVTPSERTIRAIHSAIEGADYSFRATHFRSLYGITPYVWHERAVSDGRLEFLFDHGGHRFYRELY